MWRNRASRGRHIREPLLATGLGLLLALLVELMHRWGAPARGFGLAAWEPHVVGVFGGLVLGGVACAIAGRLAAAQPRRADGRAPASRPRPRCILIGFALTGVGTALTLLAAGEISGDIAGASGDADTSSGMGALGTAMFGIPWSVAGVVAGMGVCILLWEYGRLVFALSQPRALTLTGGTLMLAGALDLVGYLLPVPAALGLIALELLGSAACLVALSLHGPLPISGHDASPEHADVQGTSAAPSGPEGWAGVQPSESDASSQAGDFGPRTLLRATWRPAVGALICAFVMGLTWNTDLLGVQLNDARVTALEKTISLGIAGVLLVALAKAHRRVSVQTALLGLVLPLMVVTFIVRPYFLGAQLGPAALMLIGIARETGFALFFSTAWLVVGTTGTRTTEPASPSPDAVKPGAQALIAPYATTAPASILVAGLGAAGVLGFYALPALGALSGYLGAILFTAYLVAIALGSALSTRATSVSAGTTGSASAATGGETKSEAASPSPAGQETASHTNLRLEHLIEARCAELGTRYALTPRERDITLHLARGHSYAYIAGALSVSENTVRTHVRNMYRKVGVSSREELLARIHEE